MIDSTAFDAFAAEYDESFTHSQLGQWLRPRVWPHLARHFQPGDHILELACGTGEDALWLAQHGMHVTATDGSAEMVKVAAAKAARAGLSDKIQVRQMALQTLSQPLAVSSLQSPVSSLQSPISESLNLSTPPPFSGILSNFGGLNTIEDLRPLAQTVASLVKPGGKAVLVPMGPVCPWELAWYGLHGELKTALRRFRGRAQAKIGDSHISIWYPSARQVRQAFAPWFHSIQTESLGFWLPPSYLEHLVHRWPRLFRTLSHLDQATASWWRGWGDHFIIVLERTQTRPGD
ncbi:MAG: methyltransferase domain-containing protein [Anaerolineae bacterium]|nr:methyltransferase domain-containing protein [Anaerolineae bacterium]